MRAINKKLFRLKRNLVSFFLLLAFLIASLLGPTAAQAAGTTSIGSGNGLRISPVRSDLTIQAGQSQTIDVFVQNLTKNTANLQVLINDFVADNDESGSPKILLSGQADAAHSLKQFVTPINNIAIGPNQQQDVEVIITIPKGTAGGGYYGVVRFQPASASGGGNVSLAASVGSLVLVTVPGKIIENTTIASFDVRKITTSKNGQPQEQTGTFFLSSKNLNSVVRFNNQGNLQEQPFGKIELKKGSKVIKTYEVNNSTPPGNVLPGSIRKFSVPLNQNSLFGKYTLIGNFGYGSKGQLLTAQTTFYVIPLWLIICVILLIALIVLGIIFVPKMIKSYNRRVIRRAGRK